jgi:guanylate kinase
MFTTIGSSHYERVFKNWDKFPRKFQLDFTEVLKLRLKLSEAVHDFSTARSLNKLRQYLRKKVQDTDRRKRRDRLRQKSRRFS